MKYEIKNFIWLAGADPDWEPGLGLVNAGVFQVSVGQTWFSFGWESQLLETGFLAIWSVPLWSWRQMPSGLPSPKVS